MKCGASMQADEVAEQTRAAIAAAKEARDAFLGLAQGASFGEVVEAFDRIARPLDVVHGPVSLASQTHPSAELREACQQAVRDIAAFGSDLSLDRGVFDRLGALDPADAPGPEERRLLEHSLRDFRRSGVDRDEAARARIHKLNEELVEVGQEFDLNIVQDTRSIVIEEGHAGLEGLPADYLAAHPEDEQGAVTITTNPPDLVPFLAYAVRGDLRQRLHFEHQNRGVPGNLETLGRLLAKRFELAQALGYGSWADYVTEDKMVESAGSAREFIQRIAELARPRLDAEYAELLEAKRADESLAESDAESVRSYETQFYMERVKQARFGFDSQAVRPYFAFDRVRDGVLATSAALFGVEFRRDDQAEVWHASVECYEVLDGGEVVARFYLDMHPREDKYKHAAMFDLRTGIAGECVPEACLVCNFPEPSEADPALMLHSDVTTFFHEFGHLLHHLFGGRQRYLSFSGIRTEWDFVEAPSQMYEEWAWDARVLQRFALHHETGEPIPPELVAAMRAADEYGKGLHVGTQMFYAALSLSYYDRDPASLDLDQHMIELRQKMVPVPHEEDTHFQASFGHLHGYSAIYYTYMWSLVIAKDLFSRFEGDLMDSATANDYRAAILAPGGSRDAAELVRNFLGRDYGFQAWKAWLNR